MKKKENIGIVIFCVWMALVVGAAVFAPLFAPNDPNATNLSAVQQGASAQYPLGTDMLGRCMLSRVLYGARVSVLTGLGVTLTVFAAGVALWSAVAGVACGVGSVAESTRILRAPVCCSTRYRKSRCSCPGKKVQSTLCQP